MLLHLCDAVEVAFSKPFDTIDLVVPRDMDVPPPFAGLDVDQAGPRSFCSAMKLGTVILRSVIDAHGQWLSSSRDDLIKRPRDAFR